MTSERPHRAALSQEEAVEELQRNAGTQFDPHVVNALLRALSLANPSCSTARESA
jgi:HD-GYP domain-containing protein (c-di-GMP phosphodiesterase class II)